MKKNNRGHACQQAGFTLFELLISISIIGILIAVATSNFTSAQRKARDTKRVQDVGAVQKAAEQYYSVSNYVYPANTAVASWVPASGQSVLESFPMDPKGVGYTQYNYRTFPASGVGVSSYFVCAAMEVRENGNAIMSGGTIAVGGTGPYYCMKSQQ